jgi:hypothetical protein
MYMVNTVPMPTPNKSKMMLPIAGCKHGRNTELCTKLNIHCLTGQYEYRVVNYAKPDEGYGLVQRNHVQFTICRFFDTTLDL